MGFGPIKGFIGCRLDWVIKVGGSLTRDLEACSKLMAALASLVRDGHPVLVIPGGGQTDKVIEAIDRERRLRPETAHRACALAQDQTGLLLADCALPDDAVAVDSIADCRAALEGRRLPILLPSRLLFDLDPIERSWEVTSDAVGAWIAWLLEAPRYAILTDVDGVFAGGETGSSGKLIVEMPAAELAEMGHTAVDACAAAFIRARNLEAVILNGFFPDRIVDCVLGRPVLGTLVKKHGRGRAPRRPFGG